MRAMKVFCFMFLAAAVVMFNSCSLKSVEEDNARNAPVRIVENFMQAALLGDFDKAFSFIEIDSLVNFGIAQREFYQGKTQEEQRRYRHNFIEGIILFLFWDKPKTNDSLAIVQLNSKDCVVEISGPRPGKRLWMTLGVQSNGLRIIRIDKKKSEGLRGNVEKLKLLQN